jgi:hypothetical protein
VVAVACVGEPGWPVAFVTAWGRHVDRPAAQDLGLEPEARAPDEELRLQIAAAARRRDGADAGAEGGLELRLEEGERVEPEVIPPVTQEEAVLEAEQLVLRGGALRLGAEERSGRRRRLLRGAHPGRRRRGSGRRRRGRQRLDARRGGDRRRSLRHARGSGAQHRRSHERGCG